MRIIANSYLLEKLMDLEKVAFENNETETETYKYLTGMIRLANKELNNYLEHETHRTGSVD